MTSFVNGKTGLFTINDIELRVKLKVSREGNPGTLGSFNIELDMEP